LFDFRASHKNYREALRAIKPPIVPFLGIYTKDIFAVQENNPDHVPGTDHINFEKFSMLVKIIQDVLQYQTTSYTFETDVPLQHFLRNVKAMDEEAVYEASIKKCEDNTPTVVRNPLFQQDRSISLHPVVRPTARSMSISPNSSHRLDLSLLGTSPPSSGVSIARSTPVLIPIDASHSAAAAATSTTTTTTGGENATSTISASPPIASTSSAPV
jgi:hypothetical protein